MHSLLATNETDDMICVTEPWFSRIGVTRADDERNGKDVLGRAAHPNWDIHYHYFCGDLREEIQSRPPPRSPPLAAGGAS